MARFLARARMVALVAGMVVTEVALVFAAGWLLLTEGSSWLGF